MTYLQPSPQHRFTFGLPTSTNRGFYPTHDSTTPLPIEPWDFVHGLAEIGAWGVAINDDELVPPTATPQERESLLGKFRAALDNTGVVVSTVATDLYRHRAFTDGAFTSADGDVRRCAIRKALRALDLGMEFGAPVHVLSGANEEAAATVTRVPTDTLDRYREAINFLCGYVRDQGYAVTFALMPGASGPHGDALLPTIGHALAFIETLDRPDMVGLSPRATPESMAGQNVYRDVAHAMRSGRLAQIELDPGAIGYGTGSGSAGLKDAFFLVKSLEESAYTGARHFGARPCHGEHTRGVWDVAAGCMRTYLALAAKARRFADDPDIQEALADAGALELAEPTVGPYSREDAQGLAAETFDPDTLAERGYHHERLDQLITDLLLGLR